MVIGIGLLQISVSLTRFLSAHRTKRVQSCICISSRPFLRALDTGAAKSREKYQV